MSYPSSAGLARSPGRTGGWRSLFRVLMPLAWLLVVAGYFGPWISHITAALTLAGAGLAEFVKFLPAVQDGSLNLARQLFYLPPVATVVAVALLCCSRSLGYPIVLRWLLVIAAVPVSLQLLPPAWSPASLLSAEFRLQTLTLVACWLLLALAWLWGRLPVWVSGLIASSIAVTAVALATWQFELAKPAINAVYGWPPGVGWGFFVTFTGLVMQAIAGVGLVVWGSRGENRPWRG